MGFKDKLGGNVGNGSGSGYFKPVDFKDAYVLLIEPTRFKANQPNPFYKPEYVKDGKTYAAQGKEFRNELIADITAFATPEHLEAGTPSQTLNSIVVTDSYLASDLEHSVDKVEVARLIQKPNKNPAYKPSWAWSKVEGDNVMTLIGSYYDAREAELDSAEADLAAALED